MKCRHCENKLEHIFCDLHTCPPSNAMLTITSLNKSEKHFPLKVFVCNKCWLVQIDEFEKALDIFNKKYTYFSSYSNSWLLHAKNYTSMMIERFSLNENSYVVEIASNDGYLLQYFKEKNIPVLGVEPSGNTAAVAIDKGIKTLVTFFNSELAKDKLASSADLILGNNVLAHVPDINDFVKGVKIVLKHEGVVTFEFPHLCKLVEHNQFDTIYHEHFSYFSLTAVKSIFEKQGLSIFDVQELATHGGSLRIFAKHTSDVSKQILPTVQAILNQEETLGVNDLNYYAGFQDKVNNVKYDFIQFLIEKKREGKKVIAYGAAAKGNTLLNYCGIKGNDLINFVIDASPHKQNKFLPGSRIPVYSEDKIKEYRPDYILILPWNIKTEITEQLSYIKNWGGQFVVAVPNLQVF